jgi:hypothetical protein
MTTLTNLSGKAVNKRGAPAPAHYHTVGVNLKAGAFRAVKLGAERLLVSDGKSEVAIPLEELIALAEPHLAVGPE